MKKLATTLISAAALAVLANASFAANAVRISQAYGGGGGAGTYLYDYVELFNASGSAVTIGGWCIAYGSSTGTWGTSGGTSHYEFPAGTLIQPCSYVLVQLGPAGSAGAPLPVTPDFTSAAISASQSTGKFGLFTAIESNVACGAEVGTVVDKVSYGPSATCAETAPTAATTNTQGLVRNNGGNTDTDSNVADFTLTTTPVPHNSASPPNANCQAVPTIKSTWGQLKSVYR